MNAVVEAYHDVAHADWPTGPSSAGGAVLSGRMSREDVGTALASIAQYNDQDEDELDGPALLGALLRQDAINAPGGVRVRDVESGVVVEPGCCAGLEDWRDWYELLDGKVPWLGHSPEPGLELSGASVRLWPDSERTDEPSCEIALADLPGHLERVRQDLLGFLDLVRQWAPYGLGDQVAAQFDEHFHISAPL
jgi:hypothetical protein